VDFHCFEIGDLTDICGHIPVLITVGLKATEQN